ncbi:MAG: hypothetical protein RLZZ338_2373 [Cyanobacteriota bacterium]
MNLSPITDHRLPITDHRLPITDYRLPITDYRLPITDYRLPIKIGIIYQFAQTAQKGRQSNIIGFVVFAYLVATTAKFHAKRFIPGIFFTILSILSKRL